MRKKLVAMWLGILMLVLLCGCGGPVQKETAATQKIPVTVSFDAMREFVEAVGGDKVEVSVIIPDGTEPHAFMPKAEDMKGLHDAKVFVVNGLGMEPWADAAVKAAENDQLIVVRASDGVEAIANTDADEIAEHGAQDPHSWLSLKNAKIEVINIQKALCKADPENHAYYEERCTAYLAKLDDLQKTYQAKFQQTAKKNFVTGHAAFAYLCRDFGLQQSSVEDVFADGEPNAAQLAKLVDYCRAKDVHTVFAEEMASPEVSETLAREVKAEVKTIYTMESHEDQKDYLERMQENLDRIYESLK